jgi:soluble lytic murein transglycosylase
MKGRAPWKRRIEVIMLLVLLLLLGIGALKLLYPLCYEDEMKVWTDSYSLDLYLVAAVIRAESRFDPHALSHAGAIGLMQIIPTTGEWIAAQIGEASFTIEDLYDPEVNIRFGTWYLRYLLDRFGDMDVALAAYNAGPSNAIRWQAGEGTVFPETARYIARVKRGQIAYRTFYGLPWLGWLLRVITR